MSNMNKLSYQYKYCDGILFYELLIDSKTISSILEDGNLGIPVWDINNSLPKATAIEDDLENYFIVTVCGCSYCRIIENEYDVVFEDFRGDVGEKGKQIQFQFTKENFNNTISKIVQSANNEKNKK